jgi:CBS domain containing-hemolysin-like protein
MTISATILLWAILGMISVVLAYFDMSFRTLSGLKVRVLLGPGEDIEGGFPELPELKMALQLALFTVNTPILISVYLFLAGRFQLPPSVTMILTLACTIPALVIANMVLPALFIRVEREEFSNLELKFLRLLHLLYWPLVKPAWKVILRLRARHPLAASSQRSERSEEEIQDIIEAGEEEGIFLEEERELLHSVVEFSETLVKEVMIPRTQMVCVSVDEDFDAVRARIMEGGFSRLPVYKGTIDNIVGILNVKDLVIRWDEVASGQATLEQFLREPYFIPETKRVSSLLREFQKERIHIAVVVDEYGGVEGLVTLEDLIEELVGEIHDEYDRETEYLKELEPGVVQVDARIEIEKIEEYFDTELPEGDYETMGGFIFQMLGRVPAPGESVEHEDLHFEVVEADERRIYQVRITRREAAETPDPGAAAQHSG